MRINYWSSDVCSSDLKDDPDSDEKSFFRVWERNIRAYRSKIHLNRGDLVEKSKTNIEPLDIAYIDIVKHRSLVNPMIHFYGRVKVGGIVLQQDYFHWQSPWLVYQMEHLSEYFELLGDRSEEHTSELQSLMRISYAVFCLKTKMTSTHYVKINTNH